jgi:NitT/TauT family transport system permease protein
VLVVWQAVIVLGLLPPFILPAPLEVLQKLAAVLESGMLQHHTFVTLQEMTLGLMWGVAIGSVLGYLIAHNRYLEAALSPLIVAFQATPVVAYAPLLIIWFGNGMTSKVVTCAIIVFFPTLINTIIGIRSVPAGWHDVFRSMQATRWQRLWLLELPAALPVFLAGLKTSATLALIGAVVGEFVGAREGLGYMVTLARSQFDTPLVFVGVFTMTALALSFYSAVSVMERVLLRWQRVRNQSNNIS